MSTGKTVGATVTNDVDSRRMREAQKQARIAEAERRAKSKVNKEISKQYQKHNQLHQKLDTAKSKYSDLTYQLPLLSNIDTETDINAMRSWVSTAKQNLKEMEKTLELEIEQAHKRHLARIKKAETWQQIRTHHAENMAIHTAIGQVLNEYGKLNATITITLPTAPTLPVENATQPELDNALLALPLQKNKLQQQLQTAENQLLTHHNLQSQRGKQLQAVNANDRLQAHQTAERQQARQQLTDYGKQQAKSNAIPLPRHVATMAEHYMGRTNKLAIKKAKQTISDNIAKEKKRQKDSEQAMQMLNQPPANETANIELAKHWQALQTSLVKVSQGNKHYVAGFEKLTRIYTHLHAMNQRLINDAYIQATLEEQLSKAGLNMVSSETGATIYSDNDDVMIEAKRVQTDNGVVLQTQQVFADNLDKREVAKISKETCQKLQQAVNNTPLNSAIKPSADDGTVLQRRRQHINQQRQRAMSL